MGTSRTAKYQVGRLYSSKGNFFQAISSERKGNKELVTLKPMNFLGSNKIVKQQYR